jgi:hypothetical protein
MALRSYETTPVREVALSCALDLVNAGRAAAVPPLPPLAADSFFAAAVDAVHDGWARNYRDAAAQKALAAFEAAAADSQGQILSVLGMSAYAALPPADLQGALAAVGMQKFLSLSADDQNRCFALAGLGV